MKSNSARKKSQSIKQLPKGRSLKKEIKVNISDAYQSIKEYEEELKLLNIQRPVPLIKGNYKNNIPIKNQNPKV